MQADEAIVSDCEFQNPVSTCTANACIVETKFIKQATVWAVSNVADMANYKHGSSSFNTETDCPINDHGVYSQKKCCGNYPTRFPYKTVAFAGDARECCGGVTYNPLMLECCTETSSTLAVFGTC